jgi:CheY-like chemotaxis protein
MAVLPLRNVGCAPIQVGSAVSDAHGATTGGRIVAAAQIEERIVLVVDDEPVVRRLVSRMLTGGPFAVLEAADALEALDMVRTLAPRVDLVITDINMPGMDGYGLVERLLQLPAPPWIVFITAREEGGEAAYPTIPLLRKPFERQSLRMLVGRLLGVGGMAADHGPFPPRRREGTLDPVR